MSIEDRPLWRDYSANQDNPDTPAVVNVKVAVENGVVGIITRAGSSWTYEDPTFRYIYDRAGELGIYRSSYWNFSPGADVDNQLAKWFSVHPIMDIIPRFATVEINWNDLKPYQIAAEFYNFSETYLQKEGERPGIYTRKQLADLWLTPFLDADWLNEHFWWIAQYDDYRHTEQDKPLIPPNKVDISRCWLRQTADQMVGFPGEAESIHVDRNRFPFGAVPQMHEWIRINFGDNIIKPEQPDCCEKLEQRIIELEKNYKGLFEIHHTLNDYVFDEAFPKINSLQVDLNTLREREIRHTREHNTVFDTINSTIESINTNIGDLQVLLEMTKDAVKLQDVIIDSNRLVGSQNWEMIEDLQKQINEITIPETNHSHRKIFSWLFNKK